MSDAETKPNDYSELVQELRDPTVARGGMLSDAAAAIESLTRQLESTKERAIAVYEPTLKVYVTRAEKAEATLAAVEDHVTAHYLDYNIGREVLAILEGESSEEGAGGE